MARKVINFHFRRLLYIIVIAFTVYFLVGFFSTRRNSKNINPLDYQSLNSNHPTSSISVKKYLKSKVNYLNSSAFSINKEKATEEPKEIDSDVEKSEDFNLASFNDPRIHDHDYYCEKYSEWLQISENCFVKKSFSFYLVDKNEYRTFLLLKRNNPVLTIDLYLEIFLRDKYLFSYIYNSTAEEKIKTGWFVDQYGHTVMKKSLNLKNLITSFDKNFDFDNDKSKLNISVYFYDRKSKRLTNYSIPMTLKSLSDAEKTKQKSALLCAKCFYFKPNEYKKFFWWVELNKMSGYNQISICNNSIPNTKAFNKIFERSKNFLIVKQMKCIPNFFTDEKFKNFKFLK